MTLLLVLLALPLVFQAWLYVVVNRVDANHITGCANALLGLVPYLGLVVLLDVWTIRRGWRTPPRSPHPIEAPKNVVGKVLPFPDRDALVDDYRLDPIDPDTLEIP